VTQYHIPEDMNPQIMLVLTVPGGTVGRNVKKTHWLYKAKHFCPFKYALIFCFHSTVWNDILLFSNLLSTIKHL